MLHQCFFFAKDCLSLRVADFFVLVTYYHTHFYVLRSAHRKLSSAIDAMAKFSGNGSDFTTLCINSIRVMRHDTCNFDMIFFRSVFCLLYNHCLHNRTYLNQFMCRESLYWLLVLRIGDFHFILVCFLPVCAISAYQTTMTWANDAFFHSFHTFHVQLRLFCRCCVLV